MNEIKLNSVNFEHGMLLTPDHFIREERYFDASLFWLIRYATDSWGLVGPGPRVEESERGAVRYDPVVTVIDEEEFLNVTVSRCRAITPSGCIIDIEPTRAISRRFAKADLEGAATCGIYVLALPHEKETVDGPVDNFNPQMQTERRPQYRLNLQPPGQYAGDSLAVGRIRKSHYGASYEKDGDYIPPCTTMLGHSELVAGWRRITDEAARLEARLIELHRAMQEFLMLFRERGIDTDLETASMTLVARILSSLQFCLHEIMDPVQQPRQFFRQLRRLFHYAALHLDLTPQVQGYFDTLRESGETEFVAVLETQRRIARNSIASQVAEDLATEIRGALRLFADLWRLERALEGKYLDFRINHALESMNFVFDRGGKVLYRIAAKPSRTQAAGADIIITFAQLRLEGREKYRLILVGEENASFESGSKIAIEIRINEGSGFRRPPVLARSEARLPDQSNFEYDFDAPDVPTITDLRVTYPAHHPIRTALLYVRQRFYPQREERPAKELSPPPARSDETTVESRQRSYSAPSTMSRPGDGTGRKEPFQEPAPSWDTQPSPERPSPGQSEPPFPPRRRRLE